jgi:hypothetical protein
MIWSDVRISFAVICALSILPIVAQQKIEKLKCPGSDNARLLSAEIAGNCRWL